MTDILALQLAALPAVTFPPNSRYGGVATKTMVIDGRAVLFLQRRFVPQPDRFAVIGEHVATQGERLDQIAAQAFGDPEMFWRLCDANRALRPAELTDTIGRRILITLPEGIAGPPHV